MATRIAEIPVELPEGVDCAECASRLQRELATHRGLSEVTSAGVGTLRVAYDPDLCSLSCLHDAADEIGARLGQEFRHEVLPVEGMDCYDCAQTIERAVGRLDGVLSCSVSFPAAQLRVEYDGAADDVAARLRRQIASLGYRVPPVGAQPGAGRGGAEIEGFFGRFREHVETVAAALFLVVGVLWSAIGGHSVVSDEWYAASVLVGGWRIARAGAVALWATRRPDINFLMTIAVVGAMAIDAWLEAALVVVLFSIGEVLESYAVERARRSIAGLLELSPERAVVLRGDEEREVDAASLETGDAIVVRPGERLAADGTIEEGSSSLDESSITGESVPVEKDPGARVFAGTLNGEGRLVVRVDAPPGDTTLDRIGRAVTEAQARKSPTERWVDRFARVYTPVVLVVAAVTALVPPLLGASFSDWFYRGLALLILACPCALVIATPVAIVAALARASSDGVLVKGGAHLETAANLRAVAFDKTGTITSGRPRVTGIVAFDGVSSERVLQLAASVEAASEHPLARAIVDEATDRGVTLVACEEFTSERGLGITGNVDGLRVRVGRPEHFDTLDPTVTDAIAQARADAATVALVGTDDHVMGLVALADTIRDGAPAALRALRDEGVQHTVLLTGDHQAVANDIARRAGVDEVRAELLPDDKVTAIALLEDRFGTVAMVGDGVNDAPALARSSLGIAMGTAGSPTAIETADVALMGDDLAKLPRFVALARATRAVVRQNIVASLATKAVAAVFAVAGLLPLWLAVLADVGATLLVVINGLRLLRPRGHTVADRGR